MIKALMILISAFLLVRHLVVIARKYDRNVIFFR